MTRKIDYDLSICLLLTFYYLSFTACVEILSVKTAAKNAERFHVRFTGDGGRIKTAFEDRYILEEIAEG